MKEEEEGLVYWNKDFELRGTTPKTNMSTFVLYLKIINTIF